jgi:LysM repeat protein
MNLFDFVKDIGNKVYTNTDDASTKVKEHIEADNPGVENLEVEVVDGVAKLKGKVISSEAYEKTVLMVGNILGISSVETDELEGAIEEGSQYYEIAKGDTLWKVAQNFYGNGSKYQQIFEANREVIKDPDAIFVGQKIRIPVA